MITIKISDRGREILLAMLDRALLDLSMEKISQQELVDLIIKDVSDLRANIDQSGPSGGVVRYPGRDPITL